MKESKIQESKIPKLEENMQKRIEQQEYSRRHEDPSKAETPESKHHKDTINPELAKQLNEKKTWSSAKAKKEWMEKIRKSWKLTPEELQAEIEKERKFNEPTEKEQLLNDISKQIFYMDENKPLLPIGFNMWHDSPEEINAKEEKYKIQAEENSLKLEDNLKKQLDDEYYRITKERKPVFS